MSSINKFEKGPEPTNKVFKILILYFRYGWIFFVFYFKLLETQRAKPNMTGKVLRQQTIIVTATILNQFPADCIGLADQASKDSTEGAF